jgi:hypothetical protein
MLRQAAAGLFLSALGGSCGGGVTAETPPSYPPGTALAVGGLPIPAAEIERAAEAVRLIYPDRSPSFQVTQALQTLVLPRAALRPAYPEERAAARASCEAALRAVRAGDVPPLEPHTGTWAELSLILWDAARRLAPGTWSEPIERVGGFSLVELVERGGFEASPAEEVLTIRVLDFGYLPAGFETRDLDPAMSAARLEVVDPAYDDLVPERLRYQMRGEPPESSTP